MPLSQIPLAPGKSSPPEQVSTFLTAAEKRIDHLFETEQNKRIPRFIPSDPLAIFRAIDFVTGADLPLGRVFCEWGSGFGVATGIAALLGYEAYGIEIEPSLVDASESLADEQGLEFTILNTSYIPEGFESYAAVGGEELVLPESFSDHGDGFDQIPVYDGMPYSTDEIDLFFVYPWPGEQEFMQQLFEAVATEGAILLTYLEDGEVSVHQKVAGEGEFD
ncbi:MAG: hypothetical protein ACR2RV_26145 [Verrucomicrobiales bacterium]